MRVNNKLGFLSFFLFIFLSLNTFAALDVFIQDQSTGPIDLYLSQKLENLTLAKNTTYNQNIIEIQSGHSVASGDYIEIYENKSFYQGLVLNVNTNNITLNIPLDHSFTTNSIIKRVNINANVDGSVTPVVFSLTPKFLNNTRWDIVRTMFVVQTTTQPDSSKFGDISGGLTNGVYLRKKNGDFDNYFFMRTNGDCAARAFDIAYDDRSQPQSEFFFRCRRTYGGSSKTGVIIRLNGSSGEELQYVVQDDLTTLVSNNIVGQGHVVDEVVRDSVKLNEGEEKMISSSITSMVVMFGLILTILFFIHLGNKLTKVDKTNKNREAIFMFGVLFYFAAAMFFTILSFISMVISEDFIYYGIAKSVFITSMVVFGAISTTGFIVTGVILALIMFGNIFKSGGDK